MVTPYLAQDPQRSWRCRTSSRWWIFPRWTNGQRTTTSLPSFVRIRSMTRSPEGSPTTTRWSQARLLSTYDVRRASWLSPTCYKEDHPTLSIVLVIKSPKWVIPSINGGELGLLATCIQGDDPPRRFPNSCMTWMIWGYLRGFGNSQYVSDGTEDKDRIVAWSIGCKWPFISL